MSRSEVDHPWEALDNWAMYGGSQVRPGIRADKSRRSAKKRQHGRGLSGLLARYVLGRLSGKSKRRAALDAGYGEWTAECAAQDVEGKRRGRFSMIRQFVQVLDGDQRELTLNGREGHWGVLGDHGYERNPQLNARLEEPKQR